MNWEYVIGLEVHAELSTDSKIFCSCPTAFGGKPNTQCCPVCTGFPGTLPTLNKQAVELAIRAGLALGCTVTNQIYFDRKNYFYPDLPKAYQISQLYTPLCRDGILSLSSVSDINGNTQSADSEKLIHISEIHLEEDAGKLLHDSQDGSTLIDYNRCGVPLIEIVTAPDFRSAEEAVIFLEKLITLLRHLGVSDCKMQEGSVRADINLSVRPEGSKTLGTRTEMKNLNSLRAISRAINYEGARQAAVLEQGGTIFQETRRWDDDNGISIAMRGKENACDYRYFPDPDLPVTETDSQFIEKIRSSLPELPEQKKQRYIEEFGLPEYDASMISSEKALADFFEKTTILCHKPKEVSNWVLGELMKQRNNSESKAETIPVKPEDLALLIKKIDNKEINRGTAREIFEIIFNRPLDIEQYINDNNLVQIISDDAVRNAAAEVLRENPKTVREFLSGKSKVFGFLVGQTMRKLSGQADPVLVNSIIKQELDNLEK